MMEELLNNDEELKKEFGTEWEQTLLHKSEKVASDLYSETADVIDEKDSPKTKHLNVLSKCFGHKKFRPMQWRIINSIINERRDNCAIMTTGYGKSLCYQFPSVYMGGITIVVSPLISLMEDQVLAMKVANISACLLGSANSKQRETIDDIFQDKYSLVYLTPEFCTGENGKDLLKNMYERKSINLVAIDEAHCVSSWGHDFRFQYRELGIFKEIMPDVPILAVTATATFKVRDDIIKLLKLKNPQILCTGFNRPNLFFSVQLKTKDPLSDFRKVMECEGGQWKFSGSTIIYCITRKNTETISLLLTDAGIPSLPYHAGLSLKMRREAHEKFSKDKLEVIVATIAFGMGIDKPDVRNVIHYGASNSIEGYYQEVGRAGRDGLPAKCISFYSNSDFMTHRRLREQSYGSDAYIANKEKMTELMLEYLTARDCRRQFILSYFEGKKGAPAKANLCCDNCVRNSVQPDNEVFKDVDFEGKYDFTEDAKIFLEAVNALGGKYGINMYVLFLRESKSTKLSHYFKYHLYGSGKHKSEVWWKGIGGLLEKEKYLEKKAMMGRDFKYYTSQISSKGKNFLRNIQTAKLVATPTPELINCLKSKPNVWLGSETAKYQQGCLGTGLINQQLRPTTSGTNKLIECNSKDKDANLKLYKLLLNKRYQIATSLDCMPYSVVPNKTLMDMAIMKPTTLRRLEQCELEGFTEAKISKFGEEFLKIIRSTLNIENTDMVQEKLSMEELLCKYPLATIGASARVSYTHFKSGLTVDEIAKQRGVVPTTILSHLADCIKIGCRIKLIDLGVTDEIKETIINAVKTVDTGLSLLTPIKNACPPDITFNQVRIVVNYLTVRQHLNSLHVEYEDFDDVHGTENIPAIADTDTAKSTGSNSPGKLTQLLNAIDEVNKTEKVENAADTDTVKSTGSNSPGKLTQLLNAIDEVNKTEKVENAKFSEDFAGVNLAVPYDIKNEDSNFSDTFDDADLTALCDDLETSLNEKDGQPLPKKLKTENLYDFSVLDSPPRESNSAKRSNKGNQSISSTSKITLDQKICSKVTPSNSKNSKEKLPPWLMMKRIA